MLLTNTLQINVDMGFPNRYFYINAVQGYWNLSAFKVGGRLGIEIETEIIRDVQSNS